MSADERCPRCDQDDCPKWLYGDCAMPYVDWRQRALDAEKRVATLENVVRLFLVETSHDWNTCSGCSICWLRAALDAGKDS